MADSINMVPIRDATILPRALAFVHNIIKDIFTWCLGVAVAVAD